MSAPSGGPRETLLVTAARAVLASFREPLEEQRLAPTEVAALRLLEAALGPYGGPLPIRRPRH